MQPPLLSLEIHFSFFCKTQNMFLLVFDLEATNPIDDIRPQISFISFDVFLIIFFKTNFQTMQV